MGGGDSDNVTLKAIRALKKIDAIGIEAMIILGPANPNRQAIEEEIQSCPSSFRLLPVVENISALMAWADVAVAASGSTSWELAFMGLPSVVLILSENQIAVAEHLASEGLAINLGWHRDVSARMITDKLKALMADEDARNIMCKTGQSLVDGEGIMRVIMSMTMDSLSLRPIQEQDCEQIWKWSNSPEARAASFTSQYIPWRDHVQWFKSKLHDSFCLFFMAVNGWGTPIGQVRIDQKIQEAVLSVYVEGKYRGIGCGSKIIELASNKFFQVSDMRSIYAYVKLENEESRRAFMRAGFKFQGLTTISGCSAIHLALEKNDSE
jgi:RimJ/RimL family protein N-acetyltransferase